jgi:hypothetical protein
MVDVVITKGAMLPMGEAGAETTSAIHQRYGAR